MTQDVAQWLAEIKTLRQQLLEAQQEREQAYTSAANWQRLYETEAQQRRTEISLMQQTISELKQELQHLKGVPVAGPENHTAVAAIQAKVEQLDTIAELRQTLVAALVDRDRLMQALKTEQANHTQTRKGLTTALGDAIDMLSKSQGDASDVG